MGVWKFAGRVGTAAEQIRDGLSDHMGVVVGLLAATVVLLGGILVTMLWKGTTT